ncbi:MAG TPA: c-type cytochrome [Eudoraea sp.]|nr:c-type cytochrome [Eudoraea sp.]
MFRKYNMRVTAVKGLWLPWLCVFFLNCGKDPSPPLSPSEALRSFVLAEEDVQIQLVASEPLVQDPVAIAFDEGGRLWVVEMLGFMTDIEGTGENDPVGRVSVLFDDDGDGTMDRSTVFLDSLVLPRAIALVEGGALVSENIPLLFAGDADGDFVADSRIMIDSTYGGSGMPEHSANGLWRGMDNWLYNAKSRYRYRFVDGEWKKQETEFRGQWGITHDNAGRLFYNYNWSQLHADLVPPNALLQNKNHSPTTGIDHGLTLERKIYPIRSNRAVNRGYVPGTLDDRGHLLEFASACGPIIYRGNALPESYYGDAFVCEPTANLIKRNKIMEDGFMLSAEGAYSDKEFLASSDERFRPISLASGPDGAIYVVDMYKGIIQHGPYMTPYLREITLERKLDKPVHMGRIWRIGPKKVSGYANPDLSKLLPSDLVKALGSTNGWTRDMAQRLLVDKKLLSVVPALEKTVRTGDALAKLHALWTLDGLGVTDPEVCLEALKAKDPFVAQTALRLMMPLSAGETDIKNKVERFIAENYDASPPVLQMQMVLSGAFISEEIAFSISNKFLTAYSEQPLARDVVMSSLEDRELEMLKEMVTRGAGQITDQNSQIFIEMLAAAITNKGSVDELRTLFSMLGSGDRSVLLPTKTAIAQGIKNARKRNDSTEISLGVRPAIFDNTESLSPGLQPILSAIQAQFTWPGKPLDPKLDGKQQPEIDRSVYTAGRQKFLNLCANCHGTRGEGMARFAPPLQASEWVTGEDYKLAMILLHGMEGPVTVDGRRYDIPDILPSMPSFSTLQNEDIAAIATYIRNSWGHRQSGISAGTISRIRYRTQGKVTPWKATELDTLVFDPDF